MENDATIREIQLTLYSYMFSDPNPVPDIGIIYPYFRYDGFTNNKIRKKWNMVILENDYIKVFVCPEIGGKIWGAIEKSTSREFLYFNHVVKFRDVALRGPWTSGGMEYNFGILGHNPSCATPVDYNIRKNPDGSVLCNVGSLDIPSRTKWNVEIIVYKDKAYFETRISWFNSTSLPCSFYHWINGSAKARGNLEFFYPGNKRIGHGGEPGEWPVDYGRNISFYENNNYGGYKSYHIINPYTNYFGGYWHNDDFGFGHISTYDDKPGKKIWIWGLSQQGMIWEDLLTDSDGQYIEYQSGKSFNQAAFGSTFTPFKHREFSPHDSAVMQELWFPLVNTGGIVAASELAVLNVIINKNSIKIYLSALQHINDELEIRIGGKKIILPIKLNPIELFKTSFTNTPGEIFEIELRQNKLYYSSDERKLKVDRPVNFNTEFNWESAYGRYIEGLEMDKQRLYLNAISFYKKSLEKEPAYLPALDRLALAYYRGMDYDNSLNYVLKSLSVDTYDPMANYLYGLVNGQKGEVSSAKSGFSIAAQSVEYRSAAYIELTIIFLTENNLPIAEQYAWKALAFNKYNMTALEILAIIFRKENNLEKAENILSDIKSLDSTNHFLYFEKVKWKTFETELFKKQITNELAFETYLHLALNYRKYGCDQEAIEILRLAPSQPIILLWLAFIEIENQEIHLQKALELSAEMVFPYRSETAMMLEFFIQKNNHWKLKYYAALIYWNKNRMTRAKDLFIQCGDEPDFYGFYLAKAKIFRDGQEIVIHSLKKARELCSTDWRVNLAWIDHYMRTDKYEFAVKPAKEFCSKYPGKPEFGYRYARALIKLEEYIECLSFLGEFKVLPNEGSMEGRNIYHETCIMAAYDALKENHFESAIEYAQLAKEWPVNLGVGKPFDIDERLDDFVIAYAYEKMGEKVKAEAYYETILRHTTPVYINENSKLLLQAILLKKYHKEEKALDLIKSAAANHPDNRYIHWVHAIFTDDNKAGNLQKGLLKESDEHFLYDTRYKDDQFKLVIQFIEILQVSSSVLK